MCGGLDLLLQEGRERRGVQAGNSTNSRFHFALGHAAGNKMLSESISKLELQPHRYFISVEWQQRRESMAQHRAIFEAVRDQDVQLAEQLTLAHIAHTESLAEASIENTPNAEALGLC